MKKLIQLKPKHFNKIAVDWACELLYRSEETESIDMQDLEDFIRFIASGGDPTDKKLQNAVNHGQKIVEGA